MVRDYDHSGYRYRATLHCDSSGAYRLDMVMPGNDLNSSRYRPAHIHIKLSAPGLRSLTNQLYLPFDPHNEGDPFIEPSLMMSTRENVAGVWSSFDLLAPV